MTLPILAKIKEGNELDFFPQKDEYDYEGEGDGETLYPACLALCKYLVFIP